MKKTIALTLFLLHFLKINYAPSYLTYSSYFNNNLVSTPDKSVLVELVRNLEAKGYDYAQPIQLVRNDSIIIQRTMKYKQEKALDELVNELKKENYDITKYLEDDRFEIYTNIIKMGSTAPEKKASDSVQKKEKTWTEAHDEYAKNLHSETRNLCALVFVKIYEPYLIRVEKEFNFPYEFMVSTAGVETNFGKTLGNFQAFNVFVSKLVMNKVKNYRKTISTSDKKKYNLNFEQLKILIELNQTKNFDVYTISSNGGAMGICQFMPSSIKAFVDDEDIFNMRDAIRLIAKYYSAQKSKNNNIFQIIRTYNHSDVYVLKICDTADYINKKTGRNPDSNYFQRAIEYFEAQDKKNNDSQ